MLKQKLGSGDVGVRRAAQGGPPRPGAPWPEAPAAAAALQRPVGASLVQGERSGQIWIESKRALPPAAKICTPSLVAAGKIWLVMTRPAVVCEHLDG
jgi:hypothetical protein